MGIYRESQSNSLSTSDRSHESYPFPVRTSHQRRFHQPHIARSCNQANLCYPTFSTGTELEVLGEQWNCQSAVKKADNITAYASMQTLQFLAITETWITPENTTTPTALPAAYSFSHTLRQTGRGTGLLISSTWSYQALPLDHIPDVLINPTLFLSPFISNSNCGNLSPSLSSR